MSSTDNSQKKPIGFSPEELKHPDRLLQLKITCRGCGQLVDRSEIMDYLNCVNNPDLETIIVCNENEVYHNEACANYGMFSCDPYEAYNPHIDFAEIERMYPPDLDRKAWIKELDRRIRRLP